MLKLQMTDGTHAGKKFKIYKKPSQGQPLTHPPSN